MPLTDRTYLFLHLMKTGGTTFLAHIADNFPPGSAYPDSNSDPTFGVDGLHYGSFGRLRRAVGTHPGYRMFAGHFPYLATEIVRPDVTITILRDPVERAVSALRQLRAAHPDPPATLEETYDTDPGRWKIIQDYQARQFALTFDELEEVGRQIECFFPGLDPPATDVPQYLYVPMDDVRLARAIDNASRVDVIGLQAEYNRFLGELRDRYGWQLAAEHRRRVAASSDDVPTSLLRRIADDNAYDIEFYARMTEVARTRDRRR